MSGYQRAAAVLALAAVATAAPVALAGVFGDGDVERGRQLYRNGLMPDGKPVIALRGEGLWLTGAEAACVQCHRASGLGTTEGITHVPPVSARYLTQPGRALDAAVPRTAAGLRREPLRAHRRPAYDLRSLHRALADGVDAGGETLGSLMPRYSLSAGQVSDLAAYLASLDPGPMAGVEGGVLHLATVVDSALPISERATFERTLRRCIETGAPPGARLPARVTAEPAADRRPAGFPSRWQLHLWALEGEPTDWTRQLASHAGARPVFALISGLSPAAWRPVQHFCESRRLPCVLPQTAAVDEIWPSDWTFHFSRAVSLEAALAEEDIRDRLAAAAASQGASARIVQIVETSEAAQIGAATLARRLAGLPIRLETHVGPLDGSRQQLIMNTLGPGDSLMLWLSPIALAAWLQQTEPAPGVTIYVSTELAGDADPAPRSEAWQAALRWMHAFDDPQRAALRQAHNVRAWLQEGSPRTRREIRLIGHTVVACEVATRALKLLAREWPAPPVRLLEHLEASEEAATATAYPRFTLGPGQRVGSRGGWLLRLEGPLPGRRVPQGDWRVPDSSGLADARPDPGPSR